MFKKLFIAFSVVVVLLFIVPERVSIPVKGATTLDWNTKSFWFEPWGSSGVHKGIDIFARKGTDVLSTTDGIVVFAGYINKGGNVVLIIGPEWKVHYFAHLDSMKAQIGSVVRSGEKIGSVGDTGNAKGKPPHLHYSIVRMYPALWAVDRSTQGYKKAFYIDPGDFLRKNV